MTLRPRFSLRTLAIVVTLVCAYFGAWGLVKDRVLSNLRKAEMSRGRQKEERQGVNYKLETQLIDIQARIPFLLERSIREYHFHPTFRYSTIGMRRYYVWILGSEFKLPYETQWERQRPP